MRRLADREERGPVKVWLVSREIWIYYRLLTRYWKVIWAVELMDLHGETLQPF